MFMAESKVPGLDHTLRGDPAIPGNACRLCSPFDSFSSLGSLRRRDAATPHPSSFPLFDGDVMIQGGSGINLPRPIDAGRRFHDLLVVGDPTRHAADGEHH